MATPDTDTIKKIRRGLCEAEITTARFAHGRNVLTTPRRPSALRRYAEKLCDPTVKALLLASLMSLVLGFYGNGCAGTVGVILTVLLYFGVMQGLEDFVVRRIRKSQKAGDAYTVKVVRHGKVCEIQRSEVVSGEIVILGQGDEIPADGKPLVSHSLLVDESPVAGKTSVKKSAAKSSSGNTDANLLFRSSYVLEGNAVMQVTAVGDETKIAEIQKATPLSVYSNTPFGKQLTRIVSVTSRVVLYVSLASFLLLTVKGLLKVNYSANNCWHEIFGTLVNNFMMSVAMIIISLPKGLPMLLPACVALNARRMRKNGIAVRNPQACEEMSAVTMVCTGISDFISLNSLVVADMKYYGAKRDFCIGAAANSTAFLVEDSKYRGIGNAAECAILRWMRKEGESYADLREKAEIIDRIPFSEERKFMATIADVDGARYLFVKGAPETVESFCDNAEQKADFDKLLKYYRSKAMRTLAFARKRLEHGENDAAAALSAGGLKYIGVAVMQDPVRPDIPETAAQCRKAGIKLKIVTGENGETAREMARLAGIWADNDNEENEITGEEFARLSDEEALHRIQKIKIISRARPCDKQRFVQLQRKLGEVVAVTGNSINDVPAFTFADAGIASSNAEAAAKEAAGMTLGEDSLTTVLSAVKWGRAMYENMRRQMVFRYTANATVLLTVLLGAVIGSLLPLTVSQMLWIGLIMDFIALVALLTLPPSNRVMKKKPRKHTVYIATKAVVRMITLTSLAFTAILLVMLCIVEWLNAQPALLTALQLKNLSMFFSVFVFLQFWNLLNVRAWGSRNFAFHKFFKCHGMLAGMLLILAGQAVLVEFGGSAFRTFHLNFSVWLEMFFTTFLVYAVPETVRAIRRRTAARHPKGLITK